jgi:hypothetical protein
MGTCFCGHDQGSHDGGQNECFFEDCDCKFYRDNSLPFCAFCGAWPAGEYTSRIPPHETVACCDYCFEYEKKGFDGF